MFSLVSQEILDRVHTHIRIWRTDHLSQPLRTALCSEFQGLENGAVTAGFDDVAQLSRGAVRLLTQRDATTSKALDSDEIGLLNLFEEIYDSLCADLGDSSVTSGDHIKLLNRMVNSLLSGAEPSTTADNEKPIIELHHGVPESVQPPPIAPLTKRTMDAATWLENHQLAELNALSSELGMLKACVHRIVENTGQCLETLRAACQPIHLGNPPPAEGNLQIGDIAPSETLYNLAVSANQKISELRTTLRREAYISEKLHAGLSVARFTAVSDYLPWLQSLASEIAERNDKSVELSLRGDAIQVDRQVMQSLVALFKCLIRDSIEHGIESVAQRKACGKPVVARIRIDIVQQGVAWLLEYADDGGGLQQETLAQHAVAMGLCEHAAQIDPSHLLQIITHPDYAEAQSATPTPTPTCNRPMQVVFQTVRELGGSMALQSEVGKGLRWQFHLPLTLISSAVLLVAVGRYQFAILAHMIEHLKRVSPQEVVVHDGQEHILFGGEQIPIISLATQFSQLDDPPVARTQSVISLLLLRVVERIVAFEVDQIQAMSNLVRKPASAQSSAIRGIAGVGVLPDSSIVAILDPDAFVTRTALCEAGQIRFPLCLDSVRGAQHGSAADGASSDKTTMQVVVLAMDGGALLIPLSMVAEIAKVQTLQPTASQCEWRAGDFRWRGLNVPLVNAPRAFGASETPHQDCRFALVLWPMKDGTSGEFFAVAAPEYPTLMEIDGSVLAAEPEQTSPMNTLLGYVQLEGCLGLIPDLKHLAQQIFRATDNR